MILVTGSAGLLGRRIVSLLTKSGISFSRFDLKHCARQDVRKREELALAMDGASGVIHLAAVSRVVWAQRDPALASSVNVGGVRTLIEIASSARQKPWIVFASSREVYGQQESLPVRETATLLPMNAYADSKCFGEQLILEARDSGLITNVARLSNVYGCTQDHHDRVVPAFARASAENNGLVRLDGGENMFDFTHVGDSARGLELLAEASSAGEQFPPINFLTGRGTTLNELADLAIRNSEGVIRKVEHAPRIYDVARFVGCADRAQQLVGWTARTSIEDGFSQLTNDFRASFHELAVDSSLPARAAAS